LASNGHSTPITISTKPNRMSQRDIASSSNLERIISPIKKSPLAGAKSGRICDETIATAGFAPNWGDSLQPISPRGHISGHLLHSSHSFIRDWFQYALRNSPPGLSYAALNV
jgi:hypothetical protein